MSEEADQLFTTLLATPPDAPTACEGWTAHHLVAHLAAGAEEMAALTEDALAGRPERPTRGFAEREAPFVALDDDALRARLVTEALRLDAALAELEREDGAGSGGAVAFTGWQMTAADLRMHGRSEAALHRWDLAGDDEVGAELLGQPELTAHATKVVAAMPEGSPEAVGRRALAAGLGPGTTLAFASPGEPDVVVRADVGGVRLELADPVASPTATADPATRLLALWGRRGGGEVRWADTPEADQLGALLWGVGGGAGGGRSRGPADAGARRT